LRPSDTASAAKAWHERTATAELATAAEVAVRTAAVVVGAAGTGPRLGTVGGTVVVVVAAVVAAAMAAAAAAMTVVI
jgi:hypothetical protein